ncbi:hypothetical protein CBER1_04621 [Cercospora berteroae]|uniref:Protein kinase domain-containing protein n=1 Tax=Cercospora berteroae TaxID=357750 RepID=A0A2S6C2F6_9PEZI|nr:hypothetical protein CBER1_04621 [Cercospora berteroae]
MPSGLEETAVIVSLIGFSAAAFKGCVEGLFLLSKAKDYSRNVSGVSLTIELELHKLYSWGDEVGLLRHPQALLVDAQRVGIVCKALQHLNELVSDLGKLSTTHGLQLQEEEDHLLRLEDVETALDRLNNEKGAQSLARTIFKQRSKPWKVLKWVTFDEKKANGLLRTIRRFTHDLQDILDQARQAKIMKAVDIVLRNAVLNTVSEQDLNAIGLLGQSEASAAAAARFKKQALLLGITEGRQAASSSRARNDSVISPPERKSSYPPINPRYSSSDLRQMRLHCKGHLQMKKRSANEHRMIASYDGKPVLLEFRSKTGLKTELEIDRVSKVSFFLADLDPSFHGLSCRGYVYVHDQFAYVFNLPEVSSPTTQTKLQHQPVSYRSLRDLLGNPMISAPSLNLRISFAITLLETLLQLHTASWLHKEIRSDNLLFFLDSTSFSNNSAFLSAKLQIVGYAHARADRLFEPTESIDSELESNLYRHPASLRQPRNNFRFRKQFDMFSVGCVLIELGIWCGMLNLCRELQDEKGVVIEAETEYEDDEEHDEGNEHDDDDYGQQGLDYMKVRDELLHPECENPKGIMSEKVVARLNASAGRKYTEVVKKLLHTSAEGDATLATVAHSLEAMRSLADAL